jgi:hypothetical protein
MAASSTYTPISTTTLSSAQTSVTLNSFSGYTDLYLIIYISGVSTATGMGVRFNSDSGNNYSMTTLNGNGSSAYSNKQTTIDYIRFAYGATFRTTNTGISRINIMNYANSTTFKTLLARTDVPADGIDAVVGLWRNTNAITSLTILPTNGAYTISAGSTFTLYGIQAA